MIWAVLIVLGIPLWLIGVALISLLRARAKVTHIPGSFACKVRPAAEPGTPAEQFPRYTARAQWVHKVLVLHGGNPFLIVTTPFGITDILGSALSASSEPRLKRMEQPVILQLQTDSGSVIDLACPAAESQRLARGPFAAGPAES